MEIRCWQHISVQYIYLACRISSAATWSWAKIPKYGYGVSGVSSSFTLMYTRVWDYTVLLLEIGESIETDAPHIVSHSFLWSLVPRLSPGTRGMEQNKGWWLPERRLAFHRPLVDTTDMGSRIQLAHLLAMWTFLEKNTIQTSRSGEFDTWQPDIKSPGFNNIYLQSI